MIIRYNVPPPREGATKDWERTVMRPIQVRVCQILKQLVSLKYSTLDRNLLHLIKIIARIIDERLGMTLQYTITKEVITFLFTFTTTSQTSDSSYSPKRRKL
jgi:hypothetical protein